MGIQDIQAFLESAGLEGGAVSVDLLRIARNVTNRQQPHAGNSSRKVRPIGNKLKLIIDAENCLDRLYGGYFSDWACGGQWNRMFHFVSLLTQTVERGNIELAVVFDGTMEASRLSDWIEQQATVRQKVGMVLKHVNTKATPPPKVWWTAPICLRTALRQALRHLGITVISTTDDHRQETIAYCREYGFHGLLADDAEYVAFQPPRYFSSQHIKLTYKGSLETKEYMVSEVLKALNVSREQLCVVSSLLGNHLLGESDLQDVYRKVQLAMGLTDSKLTGETAVKSIADYVRSLPSPSNMDDLILEIFGSLTDKRADVFKRSVQYYLNGTAEGFLKYTPLKGNKREKRKQHAQQTIVNNAVDLKPEVEEENVVAGPEFASETTEQEQESLQNYRLATANATLVNNIDEMADIDAAIKSLTFEDEVAHVNGHPATNGSGKGGTEPPTSASAASAATSATTTTNNNNNNKAAKVNLLVRSSSAAANSSSAASAPDNTTSPKSASAAATPSQPSPNIITGTVSADVLRTCSLRHQKGLMSPALLHLLSARELRLPCVLEDEANRELPAIHAVYRQLRRRVYAVLFNLHHHRYVFSKKKESGEIDDKHTLPPDIIVREYMYTRANPYQRTEQVRAEALPWAVPTLHRLWFGAALDDKRRRMRALLSCLSADTPLVLNTAYVPQHMLVMACVLRYIMSYERPILRRNELDVFLCQAFNPDLMNIQYLQELTLNVVTSRGVQLAALFMQGVEMALLANDACGAPLPWLMCCPWLYFDGKLFHHTLTRSQHAKSLLDLCENHIERVVKVERIRKAILEGLEVRWHKYGAGVGAGVGVGAGAYPVSIFEGLLRQQQQQQPSLQSSLSAAMSSQGFMHHQHQHQQQHQHQHLHHQRQQQQQQQQQHHPSAAQYAFGAAAMGGAGRAGSAGAYAGQQQQHMRRSTGAVSGRGGQLQVAGVVVGSWGPNYRIQNAGRQQSSMASGGLGAYSGGNRHNHNHQQQQQQHHHQQNIYHGYQQQQQQGGGRGGGGGGAGHQQRTNRKQGPPTYAVNKKSNVFNKKKNASAKKNSQNRQRNKTEPSIGEASSEGCKSTEQGQGDGPSVDTKCN